MNRGLRNERVVHHSLPWSVTSNLSKRLRVLFLDASREWHTAACRPAGDLDSFSYQSGQSHQERGLMAPNVPPDKEHIPLRVWAV